MTRSCSRMEERKPIGKRPLGSIDNGVHDTKKLLLKFQVSDDFE